jgi:hypothetical protein
MAGEVIWVEAKVVALLTIVGESVSALVAVAVE